MSARIVFDDIETGRWLGERIGHFYNPECDHNIAVADQDIRGGVIYTAFTEVACSMHVAGIGPGWATPLFMSVIFDYPFNQLGLQRVFGLVRESNTQARFIDRRLGFREIATIPGMFGDGAGIVVCLEREDCRWLNRPPRASLVAG